MSALYRKPQEKPAGSTQQLSVSTEGDNKYLFVRLVAVSERLLSLESVFKFELTQEPMSLFKNGLMRKGNKAVLVKELLDESCCVDPSQDNEFASSVIDGGMLLHRVYISVW